MIQGKWERQKASSPQLKCRVHENKNRFCSLRLLFQNWWGKRWMKDFHFWQYNGWDILPLELTMKFEIYNKHQNKRREFWKREKRKGAETKVRSPFHQPTQEETTPEMQRSGFHLLSGGWEAWPQRQAVRSGTKCHRNLDPLEVGGSHWPSKGHGNWSERPSAPCGEKASASENLRPQTWPHTGLGLKFTKPMWSGKPKVETLAQSSLRCLYPKYLTKADTNPPWKELPCLGSPIFPEMKISKMRARGDTLPNTRDEIHHGRQGEHGKKTGIRSSRTSDVAVVRFRLQSECT